MDGTDVDALDFTVFEIGFKSDAKVLGWGDEIFLVLV